jgi:anti-sigma regulatory factor (Ser/Thr protein kinase)
VVAGGSAVSKALTLAADFARRAGLADGDAANLAVVVEEWVANVIEHGGPQAARISVRLRRDQSLVSLSFSDAGRPFDPRTAAFAGPNPQRGGGAGLAMIASLTRMVAYERRSGRNRMRLELPISLA